MKTLTDFRKTAETVWIRAWYYSPLDLKVIGFVFNITLNLGFFEFLHTIVCSANYWSQFWVLHCIRTE